jgi:hypothetical protein
MYGYIGWQKGYRPNDPKIVGSVLTSESELYFNRLSNSLELENLQSIAPDWKNFGYPDYVGVTSYSIGDKVIYNNDAYESLTDLNTGNDPETDQTNWKHLFSSWLEEKTKTSLYKLAQSVVSLKQLNKQTKSILDQVRLFDSSGNNNDLIDKFGRIVGFSFKLLSFEGLAMLLQKVGVQFSSIQTDFNMYLYHTSQPDAPIATLTINSNTPNRFEWYDFQQRMPFLDDYNAGGEYKLVYYEDDLTGQAIKYKLDNTGQNMPCGTCNNGRNKSQYYYNSYSEYMTAEAFYVDAVNIPANPLELWDTEDESVVNNQNWGINIQIDIRCDVTDIITRSKDVFTNATLLQLKMDMAHETINNTRENPNERKKVQDAFLALEGGERDLKSLTTSLNEEIEKMDFNLSRLKSPCFPCEKKGGINITYI